MEKDKKLPIKIEWAPDGEESYLTVKWLSPLPPDQRDDMSFSSEAGQQLDYYFIYGKSLDEVIAGYRQLTGKSTMPPKWAMGLWQSRERYKTEEEILNTVKEFRARRGGDTQYRERVSGPQDTIGQYSFGLELLEAGRMGKPGVR
jgi:alpha-D-xyloside xylohydrolase